MKKWMLISIIVIVLVVVLGPEAWSQCPMCKMSAESNLKSGGTAGRGLNAGILYMFFMPYILVATLGYIWYRNKKSETEEEAHKWN